MIPNQYPALRKAAEHIAYDNGMVHRDAPEEQVLERMVGAACKEFTPEQLTLVEIALACMSEEELEEFCVGGQDGHNPRDAGLIDAVLDFMFES